MAAEAGGESRTPGGSPGTAGAGMSRQGASANDAGLTNGLAEAAQDLVDKSRGSSPIANSEDRDLGAAGEGERSHGRSSRQPTGKDSNDSGRSTPRRSDVVANGRIQQAMHDLLERLHKTQDARDKAEEIMGVLKRVVAEEKEKSAQHVESLQEKHVQQRRALESRLEQSERASEQSSQALDDEQDRIKGLEARHSHRISFMREEFTEELESQKKHFEIVQGELHEAEKEIRVRQETADMALALAQQVGGLDDGTGEPMEPSRLRELEAVIMSSREKQSRLSDELSEMRLQMLGMEQDNEQQVDDMQRQLWEAQQQLLHEGLRTSGGKTTGSRKGMRKIHWQTGSKLTSIEEEDKDNTSVDGASGAMSGAEACEIGNLQDFDGEGMDEEVPLAARSDRGPSANEEEYMKQVGELKDELSQSRLEKSELKEDLAGREAELESKVQRLTELLRVSREGNASAKAEMNAAAESQQERQETEEQKTDVEALKHELFLAVEAKRIAGNRLEDMRQELEATQRRCEQTASELLKLRQKYDSMEGKLSSREGASATEIKEINAKLRTVEEERNMLKHQLEWKEVQWKSKMEHLELEHAELKRRQQDDIAKLKKELDDTVLDYKRKLDAVEQEKAFLARNAVQEGGGAGGAGGGGGAVGFLAILRCPTRSSSSGAGGASSNPSLNGPEAAHCREVGWRLLKLVPSGMALLCEVPGLKVLDVSDGAKTTWGEGLAGSLVVSLLASPTSAAWLRRAIVTHQNLASLEGSPGEVPGFAVHTLGRLEFRDGGGRPFESAVTVAHLPSEPKLGKAPTVVVIMEPMSKPELPKRGSSGRSAIGRGTRAGSAVLSAVGGASVVSDDVLPSDSASNIAARYM